MKTIINDRHMMFNIDPIQTEMWDGTLIYSLGDPNDYEMKDYFDKNRLNIYLINLIGLAFIILQIAQVEYNYLVKHGTKTITCKYETIKMNFICFSCYCNRIWSVIFCIIYLYHINDEGKVYEWHYDCVPSDAGNSIQSSTYYFNLFNTDFDLDDLIDNFLEHHPDLEESDCGPDELDCCRLDILCNNYKNEYRTYSAFNNSINMREEGRTRLSTISLPIAIENDCSYYDITYLISTYIYNDRQYYLNHTIIHIILWLCTHFIGVILIIIFRPEFISPIPKYEPPMKGSA
tara:strand:- start:60 stop:929 length:870 start_codon:yes stop_codon:yes gene_type:complete